MLEWMCGPQTGCGFGSWVYDYQNLIAGCAAFLGGLAAYGAGLHQASATKGASQAQINARQLELDQDRQGRYNALWLQMVRHARGIYEVVTQYRAENRAPSLEYRDFVLKSRLKREIDEARLLISRSHTISIGLHIEQIGKLTEFLIKLEIAANAAETLLNWDNAGGRRVLN